MSSGAEENEALKGFGSVDKILLWFSPFSFVCLAFNDQIFMYSKNKCRAGPFSFDGLVCSGRSAGLW